MSVGAEIVWTSVTGGFISVLYTVDRCKILVELVNILQRIQFCAYSKCCEANKLMAVFLNYWANMFEMFQKDKLSKSDVRNSRWNIGVIVLAVFLFSSCYVTCQGCCFLPATWQETLSVGFPQTGVYKCRKHLCSGKQAERQVQNISHSDGNRCEQKTTGVQGF